MKQLGSRRNICIYSFWI